jgi:hypothetical protein
MPVAAAKVVHVPSDNNDANAIAPTLVTVEPFIDDEEEEGIDEDNTPSQREHGSVPVGITIAYKHHGEGFSSLTEDKMSKKISHASVKNPSSSPSSRTPKVTKPKKTKTHRSSLQVFLESTLIYILCILFPTLLAFFCHHIENAWRRWQICGIPFSPSADAPLPSQSSAYLDFMYSYLKESPSYQFWKISVYQPSMDYICASPSWLHATDSGSSYSSYYSADSLFSSLLQLSGLCPEHSIPNAAHRSVVSEDLSIYTDLFYITLCSILLAVVRIAIVQSNTKMQHQDVDSITILVRCKSNHLLSPDYHAVTSSVIGTPIGTPVVKQRILQEDPSRALEQIELPDLQAPPFNQSLSAAAAEGEKDKRPDPTAAGTDRPVVGDGGDEFDRTDDRVQDDEVFGYHIDFSERGRVDASELGDNDDDLFIDDSGPNTAVAAVDPVMTSTAPVRMNPLAVGTPTRRRSVVSSAGDIALPNLQVDVGDPFASSLHHRLEREHRRSMYNISRYTNALFRLLYCSVTAAIALVYFRHADFWPWYVLGKGDTSQCWDLSGGITVGGMDSDFDHYNVVLKRYFLWQASYHIHSSTFHFLLSLLFLFNPLSLQSQNPLTSLSSRADSPSAKRLHSLRKGSNAYVRSFVQHILSVLLITIAYTFSSLRRLGAIGLFACDVSSWSLHVLQICINAPSDSYVSFGSGTGIGIRRMPFRVFIGSWSFLLLLSRAL